MTDAEAARLEAVRAVEGAFGMLIGEFRRMYAEIASAVSPGMLPGTYKVLSEIERRGPVSASALADQLALDKGQLSRYISELEGLGLVTRTPDPADARVRLIEVAPEGRERMAVARAPYEGRLQRVLASWPVETIQQLGELLQALAEGDAPEA